MSEGTGASKWRQAISPLADHDHLITGEDSRKFLIGMIEDNERLEAENDALQAQVAQFGGLLQDASHLIRNLMAPTKAVFADTIDAALSSTPAAALKRWELKRWKAMERVVEAARDYTANPLRVLDDESHSGDRLVAGLATLAALERREG